MNGCALLHSEDTEIFLVFVSQLEDKRADMERQLISMRVQYQSLQKQYAFSKQQLQRTKVQPAVMARSQPHVSQFKCSLSGLNVCA